MMNDFSVKVNKKIRIISLVIGLVMLLVISISLFVTGNTIHAEEVKQETNNQTVQQAAVLSLEGNQTNQTSINLHILAFGIVIVASAGTAGILVAVHKRNKRKQQNAFHDF